MVQLAQLVATRGVYTKTRFPADGGWMRPSYYTA